MQQFGYTRSARRQDHALWTPDTFVRAPLPGMKKATAIVHAAPRLGAAFTQYTVEFEPDGCLGATSLQRFLYVLEGEITIGLERKTHTLSKDQYCYIPAGGRHTVDAKGLARATVIEKPYQSLKGQSTPKAFTGDERKISPTPLMGDAAVEIRSLIPLGDAFDFAVNTMTYRPGATLPMVEIHVMEHGLVMLDGSGIYRLGDHWYPTTAGDFVWMGPYCPQWFGALGKSDARYLIYKDWNRHPLDGIDS